jgi:hypothetical protein
MRGIRLCVVAGFLVTAPWLVHAESNATSEMTIRVYNQFGVSLRELTRALSTAEDTFRWAKLKPMWRACRASEGPSRSLPDLCDDTLRPSELIVRLLPAAVMSPTAEYAVNKLALGFSYLDAETRMGTLSTVFADRVYALADLASIDRGRLLGQAVAHEVGHLLLRTSDHSATGLMRARWSPDALRHEPPTLWRFSNGEEANMRMGLLARLRTEPIQTIIAASPVGALVDGAKGPMVPVDGSKD